MLPKAQRLARSRYFDRIMRAGSRRSSRFFVVTWLPQHQPTQVAVVVSKKVAQRAVDRNTLRRALYDDVGTMFSRLREHAGIIVLPSRAVAGLSAEMRRKELEQVLFAAQTFGSPKTQRRPRFKRYQ